jgi:hypothetical protein
MAPDQLGQARAAIALHPAMPSQAVGTCTSTMRTLSPCSRSAGSPVRPQASAPPPAPARQQQRRRQPAGDPEETGGIGEAVHGSCGAYRAAALTGAEPRSKRGTHARTSGLCQRS